jgi:hypothetical protein
VGVAVLDLQVPQLHLHNQVDLVVDLVEKQQLLVLETLRQHHHHKEIQVEVKVEMVVEMVVAVAAQVLLVGLVMDHKVLVEQDLLSLLLMVQQVQ